MSALPIEVVFQSGQTLYAVVRGLVAGTRQVWNPTLSAGAGGWEAFTSGHWAAYAIALTEDTSTGYYAATYPVNIAGVLTSESFYQQAGGTPTLGDVPAAGLLRTQGQNVAAIDALVAPAQNLALSVGAMQAGAVIAGTLTPAAFPTNLTSATNATYQGRVIMFVTGVLIQQVGNIIAYNGTTKTIVVGGPFTAAPSAADAFIIV